MSSTPPLRSVLHWLREDEQAVGTKEGCNQGDCGACTVAVAELIGGDLRLHTANSCLLPLPLLHGKALFTIEDVASADGLHPVQQAMVDTAGSQCGFCTPGFVMSMWAAGEQARQEDIVPDREQAAEALSGNLCRCTGYRPIVDAAVVGIAEAVARDVSVFDRDELSSRLVELAEPGRLTVDSAQGTYVAPEDESDLAQALADFPSARLLAGGTDLMLGARATGEALADDVTIIAVDRVPSLRQIEHVDGHLAIGAAARLDDAWAALAQQAPSLNRMWQRFASPAIRSTGTVGGNIANGSAVADLTPVLLALDATLRLRSAGGERTVPLADFHTGLRTSVLGPQEFISSVLVPLASFDREISAYKVSRRFDDDISSVSAVLAMRLDAGVITDARVVFGGMAPTVRRASGTEAALLDQPWSEGTLAAAVEALDSDFSPIDDHRAAATFRRRTAAGLLRRWWLETSAEAPRVAVDVWSVR